jgi:hypothetical protein
MSITIKEVCTRSDLKKFIYLPEKINKNEKNWVHPVYMDEWLFYNPRKNNYFSSCDTILLLAIKDNVPVGRIMGIINHRYNDLHKEYDGRFTFLECYNDPEISHLLISTIENWLREKGIKRIVGPLAFTDKDPQGALIEGFDNLPIIATSYNRPYIPELIENEGYTKHKDIYSYYIKMPDEIPEFYQRIANRAARNPEFKMIEFKKRSQLKPYIRPVLSVVNETYNEIYASLPFIDKEMDDFAKRYITVLDPAFIKAVEKQGKLIAFIITMPDIMEGVKKAKGKIFPFGFIKILRSQNKTKKLILLLAGVHEDYRGLGLDTYHVTKILNEAKKRGMTYMESHLILEENIKMRREMEKMGGTIYKTFRIFKKDL